jgi:hypothetical protein
MEEARNVVKKVVKKWLVGEQITVLLMEAASGADSTVVIELQLGRCNSVELTVVVQDKIRKEIDPDFNRRLRYLRNFSWEITSRL